MWTSLTVHPPVSQVDQLDGNLVWIQVLPDMRIINITHQAVHVLPHATRRFIGSNRRRTKNQEPSTETHQHATMKELPNWDSEPTRADGPAQPHRHELSARADASEDERLMYSNQHKADCRSTQQPT